jgi:hypothetical protein
MIETFFSKTDSGPEHFRDYRNGNEQHPVISAGEIRTETVLKE